MATGTYFSSLALPFLFCWFWRLGREEVEGVGSNCCSKTNEHAQDDAVGDCWRGKGPGSCFGVDRARPLHRQGTAVGWDAYILPWSCSLGGPDPGQPSAAQRGGQPTLVPGHLPRVLPACWGQEPSTAASSSFCRVPQAHKHPNSPGLGMSQATGTSLGGDFWGLLVFIS